MLITIPVSHFCEKARWVQFISPRGCQKGESFRDSFPSQVGARAIRHRLRRRSPRAHFTCPCRLAPSQIAEPDEKPFVQPLLTTCQTRLSRSLASTRWLSRKSAERDRFPVSQTYPEVLSCLIRP